MPGPHPPALVAGIVAYELAAGAATGLAAGLLGARALRRVALPASGLYPIAVLALIVAAYGAASLADTSGFPAFYVAAVDPAGGPGPSSRESWLVLAAAWFGSYRKNLIRGRG